jgi:tetratricopeptide (TPR) repeat protein
MRVFVQIHSGQQRQLRGSIAKLLEGVYNLIVSRVSTSVTAAAVLCIGGLFAQQQPPTEPPQPPKKLETTRPAKPAEQEPPEEDESLKPEEFSLNPLEAQRNITAGDFYFKTKKNFHAAARRYLRATKWDPGSAEAFLKLGESEEKLNDHAAARDAYEKYLELAPTAKNADAIRKKIEKWPVPKK